jgi:predicted nucleic acid-binding protein
MADRIVVVDTSVVVPWFFTDEPRRDRALMARDAIRDRPARFVVPPLFHSELVHVLARKSGKNERFVKEALALILALGLRTVLLPEAALLRTAHWSCRGLSGYDATYVALAEDLGGVWLTGDERAVKTAGRKFAKSLAGWQPS